VPIPVFFNQETGAALVNRDTVEHVASLVEQHGTDVWWQWPVEELLPADVAADGNTYVKGTHLVELRGAAEYRFGSTTGFPYLDA
jgi:isoleucyl-tRNA synthetase